MSIEVDPNDLLLSSGVKSKSFEKVGDKVVGTIARKPEVQQRRDITTKEPQVWRDGKPKLHIRVILATDERDLSDPDDTGERAVYVKGGMQVAVATAVRKAGAKGLVVGGKLEIKYISDGPSKPGLNPPKIYEARYRAPEAAPVPVPQPTQPEIDDEVPF